MNKKTTILFTAVCVLLLTWCACNKKEQAIAPPLPGNEALTTMVLKAVNTSNPADTPSAVWIELDPTGATPPDTTNAILRLKPNANYTVQVQLLDSAKDVTSEIKDRQNYHLFCFAVSSGLHLTCTQTDHDTNPTPLPVGLMDQFTTTGISSGQVEVTLHHQPNVKNGDCAPGSIDMDCTFSVVITN